MSARPNIVLLVTHDTGRHVGCYGVDTVRTPHIDALARDGVRFTNAYCTAPQCSPSRASITTGRYPHSNGVMGLTHAHFAWDLHENERHIASVLRDAGYETVMTGFTHEARTPPEQLGFDQVRRDVGTRCPEAGEALAAWLRDEAPRDRPFYLQASVFETHRGHWAIDYGHAPAFRDGVHIPEYIQPELSAWEDFADLQGAVEALDGAVGHVRRGLEEAGLEDDTLFVFTTDHGLPVPRAKCSVYDPGLETLLIMRYPNGGCRAAGSAPDGLVSNVDLLPTMLELAGVEAPPGVQGTSFATVLRGERDRHRDAVFGELTYHDYPDPRRCVRTATHKLIVNFANAPFFMDPSQQWRPKTITRSPAHPKFAYHEPVELYDLRRDPLEEHNLAGESEHAGVRRELLDRLYAWMRETGDPLLEGIPTPPIHGEALAALRGDA